MSKARGYRTTGQSTLFGAEEVVGFGDGARWVNCIPKPEADAFIRAHHYSGSVVWSSSVHLGVFAAGALVGVLQLGVAMNPASGASVVVDTKPDQWLELNRMALVNAPPQTASWAIGFAVKYLRRARPRVAWIQSFADERCGKWGGVYQAASFLYCGSHVATFYELDGEWFHKSCINRPRIDKRGWGCGPKITRFLDNQERAVPHQFRQFRYVRPLKSWARRGLLFPVLPYPKPNSSLAPTTPLL
jgi:hypothetical protein